MHYPTDRTAHATAFVTPVVEHWLEREIAQRVKFGPMSGWQRFDLSLNNVVCGDVAFHTLRV